MTDTHQIAVEFRLPTKIRKKGKWYVSSCPSLDVHSQGHTKEEARRNLVDALVFFLESCFERGTSEPVLREAGFVSAAAPVSAKGRVAKREEVVLHLQMEQATSLALAVFRAPVPRITKPATGTITAARITIPVLPSAAVRIPGAGKLRSTAAALVPDPR